MLNERSSRQLGPGSRDTLGLLEGDEGSPFRRMDPAEGAELSLLDPATSDVIGPNQRVIVFVGLFSGLLLGSTVLLIRDHYKRALEA